MTVSDGVSPSPRG